MPKVVVPISIRDVTTIICHTHKVAKVSEAKTVDWGIRLNRNIALVFVNSIYDDNKHCT